MGYAPKSLEVVRLNELHQDSGCSTAELRVLGVEAGIDLKFYSRQLYCAANQAPKLVEIGRDFARRQARVLGPGFVQSRPRTGGRRKEAANA